MNKYRVNSPSKLEAMLFDASLVQQVPLSEMYDIKARASIMRSWLHPDACRHTPDVHDPQQWDTKLHACLRGEFFVQALRGCVKVLDVGCGEGWPSLYLARSFPNVVGMDLSPEQIDLAKQTAELMGLTSAEFRVARIEDLPFSDDEFDGVCFGGNVFTYGFDHVKMLREIRRVLKVGGTFAFEQWPVDPERTSFERIEWFIDGGPPILHYCAGCGLYARSYFIYIKPESQEGRRLAELAKHMMGELSADQRNVCEDIKRKIEGGALDIVEKAIFSGEDRSLSRDEFPRLLDQAGFTDAVCWALPNAPAFAMALEEEDILARLRQEDLTPCLRALVRSAPRTPGWEHDWVSCRKR